MACAFDAQKFYFTFNGRSTVKNRPRTFDGYFAGGRWRDSISPPVKQRLTVKAFQFLDALSEAGRSYA
jgi:hypothetical protein